MTPLAPSSFRPFLLLSAFDLPAPSSLFLPPIVEKPWDLLPHQTAFFSSRMVRLGFCCVNSVGSLTPLVEVNPYPFPTASLSRS